MYSPSPAREESSPVYGSSAERMIAKDEAKKVLFIIAHEDFRDEELKNPRTLLESKGAKTTIASNQPGEAKGMLGMKVKIDITLDKVNVDDYAAIVFVGGSGSEVLFENTQAHRIAREAFKKGKIIGAICMAPSILAHAGILKGKKATAYSSEAETLKTSGATYTGAQVEQDGLLITADGPESSKKFGEMLVKAVFAKQPLSDASYSHNQEMVEKLRNKRHRSMFPVIMVNAICTYILL